MSRFKKFLAFAFISVIKYCYGAIQIYENHETTEQNCATEIIQRIQLHHLTNVALINVNDSFAKELNLLSEKHLDFVSRSFESLNDTTLFGIYVIQSTNVSMFTRGLNIMKRDAFWNPRVKFVIIIEDIEDLQDISNLLLSNLIHDVAAIISRDVYSFGLERDECDRPVLKILRLWARCSQIHSIDQIFVVEQKTNLRGCHVKFEAIDSWPFYVNIRENKIDPNIFQDIFELIAQSENITIEVVAYNSTVEQLFDYMDFPDLFNEVEIGNIEGAVGEFAITLNRATKFDYVYPILIYYYTVITTRAKVLDNWSAVLKLLGVETLWSVLGTFCIMCIIVVYIGIFKGRVDVCRDVLIIWGYFLNNVPQNQVKSGILYRLVLWNILLFAFIISSASQACIFSAVTKPLRGYQPDTLEEINSSFQIVMSPFVHDYLYAHPDVKFSNVYNDFCNATISCNLMVKVGQTPLYTLSTNIDDRLLISLYSDKDMYMMKEPIEARQATMYFRRGSPLVEPFNRLLLRVRSAGLIDMKLDRIIYTETLIDQYHEKLSKPFKNKPQSLDFFKGIFMILISGYCLSMIFFIIEMSHKQNR